MVSLFSDLNPALLLIIPSHHRQRAEGLFLQVWKGEKYLEARLLHG